jgi:hypothetical protein
VSSRAAPAAIAGSGSNEIPAVNDLKRLTKVGHLSLIA